MNIKLPLLGFGLAALILSLSTWTPVVVISTHEDNIDHNSGWPEIAVDAVGNSYVVWQGFDGYNDEIYWVKIDASGEPGAVLKVSTHPDNVDNFDYSPQIATDDSGNSYIVWYGSDGNDSDVYWIKVDSLGIPGNVQKISTHIDCVDNKDWWPHIAVDSLGNSYVVWQGSDGNDSEIYWVKVDASGEPGAVLKVSTHPDNIDYDDHDPQISADKEGNSYIVWHGCDKERCWEEPGDYEIYWVRIDSEGIPGKVQKIPPTDPDNINVSNQTPQIAVDTSGTSSIVWCGMVQESYDIYWVKIDPSGKSGEVQKVSIHQKDAKIEDLFPQIAVDNSGNSYITWEGLDEKNFDIYWVKIDAQGVLGKCQNVSRYSGSQLDLDRYPYIAVDASGNSYIVWEGFERGIGKKIGKKICWVKIDAAGDAGGVQKISTRQYPQHGDWNSRIAVDAAGNSYVVWEGKDIYENDHIYFTANVPNPNLMLELLLASITIAAVVIVFYKILKKMFMSNEKER